MMDFRLTDNMNSGNAARVIDHLRQPRLWIPTEEDYANHSDWLEKTEAELVNDKRHALMATFGQVVVGAIVFRPEPDDIQTIGIRNISIHPSYEGRYVGAFTLRNTEYLTREIYPKATRIIIDTKTTNHAMIAFLQGQRYTPVTIADLYDSGKPDVILSKLLVSQDGADVLQPSDDHSTR